MTSIQIPKGYVFDKIEDGKIILKVSRVLNWEEFCEQVPIRVGESTITPMSEIYVYKSTVARDPLSVRNNLPTEEDAEAMLALMQLIQLRDYANGDWKPDWKSEDIKYTISFERNNLRVYNAYNCSRILVFEIEDIRNDFLEKNRGLIEIAKKFL